jgi:hypothetical protein
MQAGVQYVNDDMTEALPTREEAYAAFEFYESLVTMHKIAPAQTPDRFGPGKEIFIDKFWGGPAGRGGYCNAAGAARAEGVGEPAAGRRLHGLDAGAQQQREIYTRFNRMPASTSAWEEFADDPQFKICSESIDFGERQGGYRGWGRRPVRSGHAPGVAERLSRRHGGGAASSRLPPPPVRATWQ